MVIGGGPSGVASLIELSRNNCGYKFALIQEKLRDFPVGESLSSSVFPILSYLGIEDVILPKNIAYSQGYCSNWNGAVVEHHSMFQPYLRNFSIDRAQFNDLLLKVLPDISSFTTLLYPINLLHIEDFYEKEWKFHLFDKREGKHFSIRSPFFIDASGRRAKFSRAHGGTNIVLDPLVAGSFFYESDMNTQNRNQIITEASYDGWWYMNTLPNHKRILMFMTDVKRLQENQIHDKKNWDLRASTSELISKEINFLQPLSDKIRIDSAHFRYLKNPANNRWIATGDAASSFDPIAPLGIANAFLSGIKAAESFKNKYFLDYSSDIKKNIEDFRKNRMVVYSGQQKWKKELFWWERRTEGTK